MKTLNYSFGILFILMFSALNSYGQIWLSQYFDGADTTWQSAKYYIDSAPGNIWQVGPPQKLIFDSASSEPNVMITDTINNYPNNDSSSFTVWISNDVIYTGIWAIQWKQKLDMEGNKDFGLVEFKEIKDSIWHSAFGNPYVYNFYGYDSSNTGITLNGDSAFTGTDSTWKDIWLCFDPYYTLWNLDTFEVRFTFVSDSANTQEGWMIDNVSIHETIVHTVKENESTEYLKIFPSPTTGRIDIQAEKIMDYHIIEHIELYSMDGRLVKKWGRAPTKFFIDISDQPDGMYILNVTTNLKSESHQIVLQRE